MRLIDCLIPSKKAPARFTLTCNLPQLAWMGIALIFFVVMLVQFHYTRLAQENARAAISLLTNSIPQPTPPPLAPHLK